MFKLDLEAVEVLDVGWNCIILTGHYIYILHKQWWNFTVFTLLNICILLINVYLTPVF